MHKYITIKELIAIQEYQKYKYSTRKIAKFIDFSKSTVHRVIKLLKQGLSALEIIYQYEENKNKAGRKQILLNENEINIINQIINIDNYAPDIAAYILRKDNPKSICTKTLYSMFKRNQHGFNVSNLLRKGKNKPHKTQENRGKCLTAKTIHQRNQEIPDIKNIQEFVHLEGDTLIGKDHKSSIITLADIWSKTTIPLVTKSHKSTDIAKSIINFISKLPAQTIKTITFDQGKEFSKWKLIENICNIKIYFADAGTPSQRGLNENNNGILRRYLPKSIDLSHFNQETLNQIALKINSMPRKSIKYKSSLDLIQLF